jgi:hypothetical protein
MRENGSVEPIVVELPATAVAERGYRWSARANVSRSRQGRSRAART